MALAVLAGGLLTVTNASADDSVNPHEAIIQKIADKFGLNKDEVQKVFDEERTVRQAEMQVKLEERLAQAVAEGKITDAQKTLILNKHKELQEERSNRQNWQNLTREQRKTQMESKKAELETWANQNGIDMEYFHSKIGMKGHGGFGTN